MPDERISSPESIVADNGMAAFKQSLSKFVHESQSPKSSTRKRVHESTYVSPVKRVTRSVSASVATSSASPPPSKSIPKKKSRKSAKPSRHRLPSPDPSKEPINLLVDVLAENLHILFVGVNPGLLTAQTGFAYAHHSNRFYTFLHLSGITDRKCDPSEYALLAELFGLGNTNVVKRPTRDASRLSNQEMIDGIPIVEEKVRRWKPGCVVLVGKSVWEAVERAWKGKTSAFHYGWQDSRMGAIKATDGQEAWEGAPIFVATSTSGLAATPSWAEKLRVWTELGDWVNERRKIVKEENRRVKEEGKRVKEEDIAVKKEDVEVEVKVELSTVQEQL